MIEQVVKTGTFSKFIPEEVTLEHMVLDSQALQHLEIVEVNGRAKV